MDIHLHNFRKHINCSVSFPDRGLVLLSGNCGAGKSTILNAITYALYGKFCGKIKKPYTHGASTCKVELKYMGMHITRTSRPNRLVVVYKNLTYEDDAAQGVIEKILVMNHEEFISSSYVVQQGQGPSVLSMTPSEQLRFIETLASVGDEVKNFFEIIKEYQEPLKQKKEKYRMEISVLEAQLEKYVNIETVERPKKCVSKGDLNVLQQAMKNLEKNLDEKREKLEESRKNEKEEKKIREVKKDIEEKIKLLEHQMKNLPPTKNKKEIKKLETKKIKVDANVDYYERLVDHLSSDEILREMIQEHITNVERALASIDENIPSLEKIAKIEKKITDGKAELKEWERVSDRYEETKKTREEMKKLLTFLNKACKTDASQPAEKNMQHLSIKIRNAGGQQLTCPSCKKRLVYYKNELSMCIEKQKTTIENLEEVSSKFSRLCLLNDKLKDLPSCLPPEPKSVEEEERFLSTIKKTLEEKRD
jgi:DNA repair protein SbcC/Rad50